MSDDTFLGRWLPVLTLSVCVFVFNTSEFIPIGLLLDIGRDFGTSEAQTGMLVTIYAWVVALLSLPLMLAAAKIPPRPLMLLLVGGFAVSNFASGMADNYWMLLASRIGVACMHAVFWSVVPSLAVQAAPPHKRATALSIIVAGSSIAMVAGLPLGRVLGLWLGWRMTFVAIGIVSVIAWLGLWRFFPALSAGKPLAIREVPRLLTRPALVGIFLMTMTVMTGNFTVYSYIEPFLEKAAGMAPQNITWVLSLYGGVGFLGSWLFSRYYDRHPGLFMGAGACGIALSLLLMYPASASVFTVFALVLVWGLSMTLYCLVMQSSVLLAAPQGAAVAMSVYSGIFNVGIGGGALAGGLVCTYWDVSYIGFAGGAVAACAAAFCVLRLVPVFTKLHAETLKH